MVVNILPARTLATAPKDLDVEAAGAQSIATIPTSSWIVVVEELNRIKACSATRLRQGWVINCPIYWNHAETCIGFLVVLECKGLSHIVP